MELIEREHVLQMAKGRLLGLLALCAFLLAVLQAAAYMTVSLAEFQHPPLGKFVTVDGVRLHYITKGSGPAVVFIHGNDGMVQDFNVSLMDEASREYQAIAFDRPGHGYSQRESHEIATAEVQARLIHDALKKLGINKPVLVGHSWGGALVLAYALRYPDEISGIVLLSSVAYVTAETAAHSQDYLEQIPVIGDLLISAFVISSRPWVELNADQAFFPAHAPRSYVDSYSSLVLRPGQIKAYAQDEITLNRTLEALSPHYGEIELPVVIVTGDLDPIVPPRLHAYPLHQAIKNSSLIVIPDAEHQIELQRVHQIMDAIHLVWEKSANCSRFAPKLEQIDSCQEMPLSNLSPACQQPLRPSLALSLESEPLCLFPSRVELILH